MEDLEIKFNSVVELADETHNSIHDKKVIRVIDADIWIDYIEEDYKNSIERALRYRKSLKEQ